MIVQHLGDDRARWARIRLVRRVPELLAEVERCHRKIGALRAAVEAVADAVRDADRDPVQAVERVREAVRDIAADGDPRGEMGRLVADQLARAAEAWCEQIARRARWTQAEQALWEAVRAWLAWRRAQGE